MNRIRDVLALSLLLAGSLAACSTMSPRYGGSTSSLNDPYSLVEPGNGPADMMTPSGVPTDPTEDRNDAGGNGGSNGGPSD
jgi:hypothetical protein